MNQVKFNDEVWINYTCPIMSQQKHQENEVWPQFSVVQVNTVGPLSPRIWANQCVTPESWIFWAILRGYCLKTSPPFVVSQPNRWELVGR